MPSPRASGTSTVYVKVEICRGPGLLFFLSDTSRNQLFLADWTSPQKTAVAGVRVWFQWQAVQSNL